MKKIVSILATAAVLATSEFAADINGKVNILGDAFNFNDGTIRCLGIAEVGQSWNPSFMMSANGLSLDVALLPGWSIANFVSISAYANLNAGNAKDANDFCLGYSGNLGGVSMFVNAIVGMQKSDFGIFRAEAYKAVFFLLKNLFISFDYIIDI